MKKISFFVGVIFLILASDSFAQSLKNSKSNLLRLQGNYTRVSTGVLGNHSLEIRGGTLWAWGKNQYGQLGDNTSTDRPTPIQIGTDNDWTSVSAGTSHTLALKANGTLWAWGINNFGQQGNGTTGSNILIPTQVGSGNTWVSISAGENHNLALKADGTLWAWGSNSNGQLGDGSTTDRNSLVQVGSNVNWVIISAGRSHSLALKSDGTIWAWGLNTNGQLGDATNTTKTSPTQIGSGTNWVQINGGNLHSMGLKSDGTLWTWGRNNLGQLGDGTAIDKNAPVQVGSLTTWASIEAGGNNSYAIKADGTAWGWGGGTSGQIGDGNSLDRNSPTQILGANLWVEISAGGSASFGVKVTGELLAWGNNNNGRLGLASLIDYPNPTLLVSDSNWLSISIGEGHTIALRTNGTLWSWGTNNVGQLGIGSTTTKLIPQQIGSDNDWIAITTGGIHSLAIKSNGTLWAWGGNSLGQLGNGTTADSNIPIQVGSSNNWVNIAAGTAHSIAVKSDGTLWAWGWNSSGQLGDGTTTDRNVPTQIGSDNTWLALDCGASSTIALKTTGTLWSWGENVDGTLGDGSTINKSSPTQIGSDNTWKSLSIGNNHVLAIKTNGTLWGWGKNNSGQVGNGTTNNLLSPTQVGSANNWIRTSAGIEHSFGIQSNGTAWAWGHNVNGAFGNGTNTSSSSPIQIGSDNNWVNFTTGMISGTIALKADRTNFCSTGNNTNGILGYNSTSARNTFVCLSICNPPLAPSGIGATICANQSTIISASGIGTLSWYTASTGGLYLGSGSNYTSPVLSATTTYYVQDSTCAESNKTAVTVVVNPLPNVSISANDTSICIGSSAILTANGATSYLWNLGLGVSSIQTVNPSTTTNHIVTGTDNNGCINTDSLMIIVNNLPVVTASATASTICAGATITLTGSGATSYVWTDGASNGLSFVPNVTTTYTVTGTDINGCSNTATQLITVNSLPIVTASATLSTLCLGASTILAGNGAVSYVWTGGVSNGISFSPLTTTTYTVTGTDANNCSNTATQTITVNSLPNIIANSTVSSVCAGTSVALTGGGAISYVWSGGVTNGISFIPISTATYTVFGTDANNCTNTATKAITVNNLPNIAINASDTAICSGSSVTLTASGASTYLWNNNVVNGISFNPNSTNTYSVLGTDVNGCNSSDTIIVIVHSLPVITNISTSNTLCSANNGTANATVIGGQIPYTYAWSNGDDTSIADDLSSGQYQLQVFDSFACSTFSNFTINATDGPSLSVGSVSPVTCYGGSNGALSVIATGGSLPYNVLWSSGDTTLNLSNLSAGPYDLILTDTNNCVAALTISITEPSSLTTNFVSSPSQCASTTGSVVANVSGGTGTYNYSWDINAGNQNTQIATNLGAGLYAVIITDANGCSISDVVTVANSSTLLTATIGSITSGDCSVSPSGSAVIYASLGVGSYSYLWSNGNTNDSISGLQPGTYYCTVTDDNFCSFTQNVVIPSSIDGLQQNICMVTVDTTTLTNLIVWEKTIANDIKEFKIYRESSIQNLYTNIATVPYSSLSEYTDPVANPAIHAWRYKITAVDSCGLETPYSAPHKTIHLAQNLGVGGEINLSWTQYEGFAYFTYYIWRHDPSTGWEILDSLSTNYTTYTDFVPPSSDSRYMIEVRPQAGCTSTLRLAGGNDINTVVVKSKSNIKNNRTIGIKSDFNNLTSKIKVYPNPANDLLNVEVSLSKEAQATITIENMLGQVVYTTQTNKAINSINTINFMSGVYFVKVNTGKGISVEKVVIE